MEGGDAQAFAVRLGYNPVQVRRLVDRMGADISQNELLSELVKLKGSLDVRTGCDVIEAGRLRHIVIDGANIVSNYGDTDCCRLPIEICVGWFRERGHTDITVFIPSSWKEKNMLSKLEEEASIMYSNEDEKMKWKKASILKFVVQVDGILVSNDNYIGLVEEFPEYAAHFFSLPAKAMSIYFSLLYFYRFMPPDDPLGRMGPTLDKFLQTSSFECLKPPGTKAQGRNAKGCMKGNDAYLSFPTMFSGQEFIFPGQRSNSPKYVKRTLSRLHSSKWKEMALPNELIRSYSDQGIRYCSLPSIIESPIIDSLEDISLETSPTSDSSNHRLVIKNISDPTAITMKDHVTKQVAPPGKFNHSPRHQKVRRPVHDDFNRLSRANYWRNQPAERPFEDAKNDNFLRSHFSVPDISYGAAVVSDNNVGKMAATGGKCYSSTPNFWTNACTEQVFSNSNSRCMVNIQSVYAARAKLHYHLSAIFPRDQVDTVFRLHPEEINPRKICSTLITLFPNE